MKCILLAAGYATRLYPLTENFPKPLLEVGEKSILDWLIDDVKDFIAEFIVISNHKFAGHFQSWADKHIMPITVLDDGTSSNENRLGAVKDILYAVEKLRIDEDVLVLAGDNVLDFSLIPFIKFGQKNDCSCIMFYEENELEKQQRTGIITIDENNTITSFEEKPRVPKSNLAVPPFYFYKSWDISRISEALEAGCGYDAPGSLALWMSSHTTMKAYRMPGKRYDIGNVESYEKIKTFYNGIIKYAEN